MNEVEYDFLLKIARTMDLVDIIEVLGIDETDLVNAFSEYILEHKYDDFKDFMSMGEDEETPEAEET